MYDFSTLTPAAIIILLAGGILGNFLTAAIKTLAPRVLTYSSAGWRNWQQVRAAKRAALIRFLTSSPHHLTIYALSEFRLWAGAIISLLAAGGVFGWSLFLVYTAFTLAASTGRETGGVASAHRYSIVGEGILLVAYLFGSAALVRARFVKHVQDIMTTPSSTPPGTTGSGRAPGTGQP